MLLKILSDVFAADKSIYRIYCFEHQTDSLKKKISNYKLVQIKTQ